MKLESFKTKDILLFALLFLILESLIEGWAFGSGMRWVTTALTAGFGLFLYLRWVEIKIEDKNRASLLFIVLLICVSVSVFGTEGAIGYTVLMQPTSRLAHALVLSGLFLAFYIFWPSIKGQRSWVRFGVIGLATYSALGFLLGLFRNITFEGVFEGAGFIKKIPFPLQPAYIAVEILLALALVMGLVGSIKYFSRGDVPIVKEKWFEFSLIALSVGIGLTTLNFMGIPNAANFFSPAKADVSGRYYVNIAAAIYGGKVESVTSEYIAGYSKDLIDERIDSSGWYTAGLPQEVVLSFFDNKVALINRIILNPKYGSKDFEIRVSLKSPKAGFRKVSEFTLKNEAVDQEFTFRPVKARFVKLRILSNHGGRYVGLGEFKAFEARSRRYAPILKDALAVRLEQSGFKGGANIALRGGKIESFTSEDTSYGAVSNLIDGGVESKGWVSKDNQLPQEIVFSFFDDRKALIDNVILNPKNHYRINSAPREFEVWVSEKSAKEDFKKVGRYILKAEPVDQVVSFEPVEAKYLKLIIYSNWGGYRSGLGEVQIVEAKAKGYTSILHGVLAATLEETGFSGGMNIANAALGGQIEQFTSQEKEEWLVRNLIDGSAEASNGWASKDATFPQEIVLSFWQKRKALISGVIMNPFTPPRSFFGIEEPSEEKWVKEFELWVSNESPQNGFKKIGRYLLRREPKEQLIQFDPPIEAKFLKLVILSNYGGKKVELGEVKVIEASKDGYSSIVSDRDINLASFQLGGYIVRYTSQESDSEGVAHLIDEDITSSWRSKWSSVGPSLPQDIVFAFNDNRLALVDKVILVPRGQAATSNVKDFKILASEVSPISGFREVGTWTFKNEPVAQSFSFDPIEARYIKLRILTNYGNTYWTSLAEVKIIESKKPGYRSIILPALPEEKREKLETAAGQQGFLRKLYDRLLSLTGAKKEKEDKNEVIEAWIKSESERNDTLETANLLEIGRTLKGRIEPLGETDYFKLDLRRAKTSIINLNLSLQAKPYVRTSLTLLGADGSPLKKFDPGITPSESISLTWRVKPSEYYLKLHEPPVSIVLIWDTSGSMGKDYEELQAAVESYIEEVGSEERLVPIRFSGDVEQLAEGFTNDKVTLRNSIKGKFYAKGSTKLYDAIAKGVELLKSATGNKAIIVMTDGHDTTSTMPYPQFWDLIENNRIRLYTVGLGWALKRFSKRIGSPGDRLLRNLSLATNGKFFFALTSKELKGLYKKIADEVRSVSTYYLAAELTSGEGWLNLLEAGERIEGVSAPNKLELILDASGSMKEKVEGRAKIDIAKEVMTSIVQSLPDGLEVALRIFGHRIREGRPGACQDSELIVAFSKINKQQLINKISSINALGTTPIAYSLKQVKSDFHGAGGEKMVILVTDGKEECGGKPSAVVQELMQAGLKVKLEVVGFAIADEQTKRELKAIAEMTGGDYFDAKDSKSLEDSLNRAMKAVYEVLDSDGEKVGEGSIGGGSIRLPEGIYTVVIKSRTPITKRDVPIKDKKETRVYINKEGEKINIPDMPEIVDPATPLTTKVITRQIEERRLERPPKPRLGPLKPHTQETLKKHKPHSEVASIPPQKKTSLKIDPQAPSPPIAPKVGEISEKGKKREEAKRVLPRGELAPLGIYGVIIRTPVRSEPRVDAAVVAFVDPGMTVRAVADAGEYLQVRSKHGRPPGYVFKKDLVFLRSE